MKAAVLKKLGQPFQIESVPEPVIGPDEVLVQTRTCGICRTDLHIQDGLAYVPSLPHIPGHEPAGVVAAVGANVRSLAVGQRVVPHLFLSCSHCRFCRTGRQQQCSNLGGILGVTRPGAFAEYFAVPAANLLVIPDGVPFDCAGLVSCAVITAVHAYRRARLRPFDVAVVLVAGGIGLIMVQLLKAAGVRVIAASRSPESRRLAEQHGAQLTVPLGAEGAAKSVRDFTGGEGAQCAFDMVGLTATMKAAADYVGRGGQIIVIGEEPELPPIDTIAIAQRELEIIGSRNGGLQDAADALTMLAGGILRPPIDRRYALSELSAAMDYVRSGRTHGRVIVEIGP